MLSLGLTGEGVEELLRHIDAALPVDPVVTLSLRLPLAEGRTLRLWFMLSVGCYIPKLKILTC